MLGAQRVSPEVQPTPKLQPPCSPDFRRQMAGLVLWGASISQKAFRPQGQWSTTSTRSSWQPLVLPALSQFSANFNHRREPCKAPPGQRIEPACSPTFAENRPQPRESGTQNGTQRQDTPRRRVRRIAHNNMKSLRKTWSGRWDSNPRPQPWQGCALPLSYARAPFRLNGRRSYTGLQPH